MLLSGAVQSQPINHQVHVNYQASTFYYTNYTHCYSLHPPIDSLIEILPQKKINHVNGLKSWRGQGVQKFPFLCSTTPPTGKTLGCGKKLEHLEETNAVSEKMCKSRKWHLRSALKTSLWASEPAFLPAAPQCWPLQTSSLLRTKKLNKNTCEG